MDMVRKLILERLTELGLKRKEVSLAIGRNATYLHQFLHRGVPEELKEPERIKLAAILKVSEMDLRGPSTKIISLKKNSAAESLVAPATQSPYESQRRGNEVITGADLFGPPDLPLFSTQIAQNGSHMLSQRAVDWVARPPMLSRVEGAYAVIVVSDEMSPEHKHGSIALVNPHLPPSVGNSCVFRSKIGDREEIVIREYRGDTETLWKVRQHRPEKDSTLKKADWVCHKTVGNYFA